MERFESVVGLQHLFFSQLEGIDLMFLKQECTRLSSKRRKIFIIIMIQTFLEVNLNLFLIIRTTVDANSTANDSISLELESLYFR